MDYVIGCDIGSQSTKALLLTLTGTLAGEAAVGYGIDYPQPVWAEQPVERWTDALQQAIRSCWPKPVSTRPASAPWAWPARWRASCP